MKEYILTEYIQNTTQKSQATPSEPPASHIDNKHISSGNKGEGSLGVQTKPKIRRR